MSAINIKLLDDKEILTAANQLLAQHGGDSLDAQLHAARLTDKCLDEGDIDGHLVWLKIHRALLELTDVERESWNTVH